MASEKDLDVWERRWRALNEVIEEYISHFKVLPRAKYVIYRPIRRLGLQEEVSDTRDRALHLLLWDQIENLKEFARGQFTFFYDGFSEPPGNHPLVEDREDFPYEHVFWMINDQIASDMDVIQDALAPGWMPEVMKVALKTADEYAWSALEPIRGHMFGNRKPYIKPPEFVTYFEKLASIRVTPYTDVSLISFPLTATYVGRDFLTIPHEVGHYVYWRGMVEISNGEGGSGSKSVPIYQVLDDMVDAVLGKGRPVDQIVRQWREEILSDVYGCLIAGPVIGLSSQDLALQFSFRGFARHDGVHPVPFLRPYVYIKTLEKMGCCPNSVEKLRARWQEKLEERKQQYSQDPDGTYLKVFKPAPCDDPIGLDQVCDAMGEVVDVVLRLLRPEKWSSFTRWSDDIQVDKPIETLYTIFESNDVTPAGQNLRKPQRTTEQSGLPGSYNDWLTAMGIETTTSQPIEPGKIEDIYEEPNGTWKPVLFANGWTTRFPHRGGD